MAEGHARIKRDSTYTLLANCMSHAKNSYTRANYIFTRVPLAFLASSFLMGDPKMNKRKTNGGNDNRLS